jgi:hypothetical protein
MTKKPKPSKHSPMSPYDRDFCEALPYGYTGAKIYAGIRENIREARLAKAKKAKRRRASIVAAAERGTL